MKLASCMIIHTFTNVQSVTTEPLKLTLEPTSCIPVSLPMALDFEGQNSLDPCADSMIKQPTDKVLMLEVARSCVPPCATMRKENR